ncbi:MAG: 2Fe-2S iron-sulfur cluster binding domain-containing protein [Alphaproteobacteria bacterium]|nr:2Fe-2S iron-sulfur cluster binding domain-containing protein [Alphaproteobacteria bacterium]
MIVNGRARTVAAPDEASLLHVLRGELGLVGTRHGCGSGQCGACFVLLDGEVKAACELTVGQARGRSVTTIEGLGSPERPHPIQAALLEEQAGQCGYCLSGIQIAAAALLARRPDPDEGQVRAALARNLCRCGAHGRIVRAVLRAAKAMRV